MNCLKNSLYNPSDNWTKTPSMPKRTFSELSALIGNKWYIHSITRTCVCGISAEYNSPLVRLKYSA